MVIIFFLFFKILGVIEDIFRVIDERRWILSVLFSFSLGRFRFNF